MYKYKYMIYICVVGSRVANNLTKTPEIQCPRTLTI